MEKYSIIKILRDYHNGMTITDIAKKYGANETVIGLDIDNNFGYDPEEDVEYETQCGPMDAKNLKWVGNKPNV